MEIITVEQLKSNFEIALDKAFNKKYIIENEIRCILSYVNFEPEIRGIFSKPSYQPKKELKLNSIIELNIDDLGRKLFNSAFHKVLRTGNLVEAPVYKHDTPGTIAFNQNIINQAIEIVKYYDWLTKIDLSPKKAITKKPLTHKQKLLALHYLGLNTSKYENTKMAKILSEILELSEDNTRQILSYLSAGKNDVRTKSNLEKVKNLFENQGLTDVSNQIEKDIEKL